MPILNRCFFLIALAPVLLVMSGFASMAAPIKQHNSNAVWFDNWTGLSNATLVVVAPDGTITTVQTASGTPVFQLTGSAVLDGVYRFELRAATDEQVKIINPTNNGRGEAQLDSRAKPFLLNGNFVVSRGVIITPEEVSEDATE